MPPKQVTPVSRTRKIVDARIMLEKLGSCSSINLIPTLLLKISRDLQLSGRRAVLETGVVEPVLTRQLGNVGRGSPRAGPLLAVKQLHHRAVVGKVLAVLLPVFQKSDEVFASTAILAAAARDFASDQCGIYSRARCHPL